MKKFSYRVLALFIGSLILALAHLHFTTTKPFFYQSYFEGAVRIACGAGFVADEDKPFPALADFLNVKTETFDCSTIPPVQFLTDQFPATIWFYMLHTVGYIWKVTGVNWAVIGPLVSILFALTICFTYGLFRLVSGPWIATIGAILVAISPLQRSYLSAFRDYSKAPFLIGILFLVSVFIKQPLSWKKRLGLAILTGFMAGIGYGFRTDVLLALPIVILCYLIFAPEGLRKNFGFRIGMIGAFFGTFVLFALPILTANVETGSCTWHFILGGFAEQLTKQLGLSSALYTWLHEFNDRSIVFTTLSYGQRLFDVDKVLACSAQYDQISKSLVLEHMQTFPADFFRRFLASIPTVVNYRHFIVNNILFAGTAFLVLWFYQTRFALFYLLLIVYFCGTSFLQFQERHYFYLEFIVWWSFAIIGSVVIQKWKEHRFQKIILLWNLRSFRNLIGFLVIVLVGIWALLWWTDRLQWKKVQDLVAKMESLQRENIPVVKQTEKQEVRVKLDGIPFQKRKKGMSSELLVININSKNCSSSDFKLKIKYNEDAPDFDLSREIAVSLLAGEQGRHFYLPVYYHINNVTGVVSKPQWISFPSNIENCIQGMDRILDRSSPPLWMDFHVSHPMKPENYRHHFNSTFRLF